MRRPPDTAAIYTYALDPTKIQPVSWGLDGPWLACTACRIRQHHRVWICRDRLPSLELCNRVAALLRRCGYTCVTVVKSHDLLLAAVRNGTAGQLPSIERD